MSAHPPGPRRGRDRQDREVRRRCRRARRRDHDRGTILILTLGYVMIAAMLALVVTDVSAVYLARRGLAAAADGAALAAATDISQQGVYTGADTGTVLRLDSGVADAVTAYATDADPSGRTTLTGSLTNPTTVRVVGRRVVKLPIIRLVGVRPVTVTASADAQTVVHP